MASSIRVMRRAAKNNRALFMKSMAVAAVSLSHASVYASLVLPSIALRIGAADPRLFARFSLRSFDLLWTSTVSTPAATIRDPADFLDVDVHHLTSPSRSDDQSFSVVIVVRFYEPATSNPTSRGVFVTVDEQLELDPQGGSFYCPPH